MERALAIFNDRLALNPNANQGAQALAVDGNFRLKRPADVLRVCGQYPNDGMEQLLYGEVRSVSV